MKDMILKSIKDSWGGFTIIGKVTLFPLCLIVFTIAGGILAIFIAMDECWDAFKRVCAKIFLKK